MANTVRCRHAIPHLLTTSLTIAYEHNQAEYGWFALAKAQPLGVHRVGTLFVSHSPHIYARVALQARLGATPYARIWAPTGLLFHAAPRTSLSLSNVIAALSGVSPPLQITKPFPAKRKPSSRDLLSPVSGQPLGARSPCATSSAAAGTAASRHPQHHTPKSHRRPPNRVNEHAAKPPARNPSTASSATASPSLSPKPRRRQRRQRRRRCRPRRAVSAARPCTSLWAPRR